ASRRRRIFHSGRRSPCGPLRLSPQQYVCVRVFRSRVMKFRLGVVGLAVLALGCGGGEVEPPAPVFPVSGKVTYKGQPVAGADITFHHESGDRSAFGRTNDEGEYKLTTFSSNDGAIEGRHGVTIIKF